MSRPTDDLINQVLTWRSKGARAELAGVRRAISPASEASALAFTDPLLGRMSATQRTGARRAAAICALNPKVPAIRSEPGKYPPRLGHNLRRLHDRLSRGGGNGIESDVAVLAMLDQESAAVVLSQLVGRCIGVPVNFHDLAATLAYWGNGIDERSRQTRQRIIHDFYSQTNNDNDQEN